jgi:transposase
MERTLLRDDQWERIAHLLPGKAGDRGVTAKDNRLFIEAVLWIARTGAPWRDLPAQFGRWHSARLWPFHAAEASWSSRVSHSSGGNITGSALEREALK